MKLTNTQKKRTTISGALPPIAHTGISVVLRHKISRAKRRLGFPILRKTIDVDRQAITSLDVLQEKSISEIDCCQMCKNFSVTKCSWHAITNTNTMTMTTLHCTTLPQPPDHTTRVGALRPMPHCLGIGSTPVGPGKDTHGTQGPVRGEAVGGATTALRSD